MSSLVVLGLLWAALGGVLGWRWWTEREQAPAHHTAREAAAQQARAANRFGRLAESRSEHRRQAMLAAYAAGTTLVGFGFLFHAALPLALGAAVVNLGTLYRYLVLLLDEAPPDEPVIARPAHRRTRQPLVARVLLGDVKSPL